MKILECKLENMPQRLKKLPNWILWKTQERENGKMTKIPYQFNGEQEARANDYTTWSFFETIEYYYNLLKSNVSGIGFVFNREQNIIGIDIDHCVEYEESDVNRERPIINDLAKEIIEKLNSYTEISVSGTGIHIIIEGELPEDIVCGTGRKNSKLGLEIYRYGRYFTMSGNILNNNDIQNRTEEITDIMRKHFDDSDLKERVVNLQEYSADKVDMSNAELWEKMFASSKGGEIQDMFRGVLTSNGDHSSTDLSLCNHLAFWTGKSATRIDSMFRETGLMRDKWDIIHYNSTGETYGQRTISMAIASTQNSILDKLDSPSIQRTKLRFKGVSHPQIDEETGEIFEPNFQLNELGNYNRFAHRKGKDIKYIEGAEFMVWNSKHWEPKSDNGLNNMVIEVFQEMNNSEDEKLYKWYNRSQSLRGIKNVIGLAKGDNIVTRSDFDKNKLLFNVNNGTIDLRTQEIKDHSREDMISQISDIKYDKYALCPTWIDFVDQITLGDTELAEYLQRLVGYSMTGLTHEQIMIFLVGDGSNGKSTFVNIIKEIMGSYGKQTNSSTFIAKNDKSSNGANNDIARLNGSRFVSAIESEQNEKLSESIVKQVTGGEPVLARFLNQEFFEFIPQFKVFFTTNHKPIIKGVDNGIWRRIKLVPFNLRMTEEEKDKKLTEKLKNEMSGILNWCLEGAMKYLEDGLKEPKIILTSVNSYKNEMDILEPFIVEECEIDEDSKIIARDLYNHYVNFCALEGENKLNNRAFYRILETKGFTKKRGKANKMYIYGINVKSKYPKTGNKSNGLSKKVTKFTFSNDNSNL